MNKKTIERLRRMREAQDREIHEAQGAAPTPPATSNTSAAVSSSDARPDLLQIPSELGDFCIPIRLSEPAFEEFFPSDECLLELDNNWPLTTAESPCRTVCLSKSACPMLQLMGLVGSGQCSTALERHSSSSRKQ